MKNQFRITMKSKSDEELLKVLNSKEGEYRTEAVEAAKEEVKHRGIKERPVEIKEKTLFSPDKKQDALVMIKCEQCKHEGEPVKWSTRTGIGVLYILVGLIPALIFFFNTNPYVCPKCEKREYLVKVFNDKTKVGIASKSKQDFLLIAIAVLAGLIALIIYRSI